MNMPTFQGVKGTTDRYPEEKSQFNQVAEILKKTANSYGFFEVGVPVLENFSLLAAKAGSEVKSQIFTIEKKGSADSETLALIPEFTPGLARMFVAKQKELVKPVKWFGFGRLWRYEAPQKGRDREFYQLSAELYGSGMPDADAEIINLCTDCLKNLGLKSSDFFIAINNRKLLSGLIREIAGEKAKIEKIEGIMRIVDKSRKATPEELKELFDAEKLSEQQQKQLLKITELRGKPKDVFAELNKMKLNGEAVEGLLELQKIVPLLEQDFIEIDLSIARGFAYYTGTVFECLDRKGEFRAIAGGGRYDNLIEIFGGEKTEATGFAVGYSTLKLLLESKGLLPKPESFVEFYVAPVNEKMADNARKIVNELRKKGFSAETDLMGRKLSKQLDYASTIKAKKVLIVGPKELEEGKVVLRDMKTGKEEKVEIKNIK